jgi:hypothetical protein
MGEISIERLRKTENEVFSVFWSAIDIFDETKRMLEEMRLKELKIEELIYSEKSDDEDISYYLVLSEGQLKIKCVKTKEIYMEPNRLMKLLAIKERALEKLLKAITIELERKVSEKMTDLEKLKKMLSEKEGKSEQK